MLSRKEAVSSCQEQMDAFQVLVKSLKSWIKETTERVPIVQPSFGSEDLGKSLEETKVNCYLLLISSLSVWVMGGKKTISSFLLSSKLDPHFIFGIFWLYLEIMT